MMQMGMVVMMARLPNGRQCRDTGNVNFAKHALYSRELAERFFNSLLEEVIFVESVYLVRLGLSRNCEIWVSSDSEADKR